MGLAQKNLKLKVVSGSHPKVTLTDSYVGGHMGTKSSREGALEAIARGRRVVGSLSLPKCDSGSSHRHSEGLPLLAC